MKHNKGFTLVELLVAIAILGVITGMSIPVIRNASISMEQKKFNSYGDSMIAAVNYIEILLKKICLVIMILDVL